MLRYLLTIILAGLVAPAAWAQCPTGPVTKNTKLTADCEGGAIVITASNVFLDLNGKTITCPSDGFRIGITVENVRGVRIENGNVKKCSVGILLNGGGKHIVKKVKLFAHTQEGLQLAGSSQNWIEGVETDPALGKGSTGISVNSSGAVPSVDNTFKANKLSENLIDGIALNAGSTDNEIRDSTISKNGRTGIYFDQFAARNVIYNNIIERNGVVGMNPYGANYAARNKVRNGGGVGILVVDSGNIVQENEVKDNLGVGIAVGNVPDEARAFGNSILKNTASGNLAPGFTDLYDFNNLGCANNDWKANTGIAANGCEKNGSNADDLIVVANGSTATNKFEINARRKRSGAPQGRVKLVGLVSTFSNNLPVTVEGDVTCMAVEGKNATVAVVIDKIERNLYPDLLYRTLHLYVGDAVPVDAVSADQFILGAVNELAAGVCPIVQTSTGGKVIKGKVSIDVR